MRLEGQEDGSFCFEACLLIVSKHRTVVLVCSVGVFFFGGGVCDWSRRDPSQMVLDICTMCLVTEWLIF